MFENHSGSIHSNSAGPFLYDLVQRRFHVLKDQFVIGRVTGELVYVEDDLLSRQHCRIHLGAKGVQEAFLEDLKSTNGCVVNGKPLSPGARVPLLDGAVIEVGDQMFYFTVRQEVPPFTVERKLKESNAAKTAPAAAPAPVPAPAAAAPAPAVQVEPEHEDPPPAEESFGVTRRLIRPARIRTQPLHDIAFRCREMAGPELQISNLSMTGLGFVRTSAKTWPAIGTLLTGQLTVKAQEGIALKLRIARLTPLVVGCSIECDQKEVGAFLSRFFGVELAAVQVKDVSSTVPATLAGTPHRFAGGNCEMFWIESCGELVSWFISFFGSRIDGDRKGNLALTLPEQRKPGVPLPMPTAGTKLPKDLALNATRFLANIEGIEDGVRKVISDVIMKAAAK